jgi:hypothetical protein
MLFFQQLPLDDRCRKCCFSSIMKTTCFLVRGFARRCVEFRNGIIVGAVTALFASCSVGPVSDSPGLSRSYGRASASPERPGLATGWGEEKQSAVYDRAFVRSSSKPVGTDAIYYNDRDGVKAMSDSGYSERVEALQTAAGGIVEWGVKGGMGYLPTYKVYGSNGRRLVEGDHGSSYTLVVKNRCKCDVEVVLSVDGLDVMDGKAASFSKRGYLIGPGKTLEVEGFRTGYDAVAAFKFSSVGASYANMRHGNTRNVGVIGLAVFTPAHCNPWTWMPVEVQRRGTAKPFAEAPSR